MIASASSSSPLTDVGNQQPVIPPIRLPGASKQPATVAPLRAAAAALDGGGDDASSDGRGGGASGGENEDKLTPRILEALALLDAETAALGALSPRAYDAAAIGVQATSSDPPDDEPEWLTSAAHDVVVEAKTTVGGAVELEQAAAA